MDPSPKLFIANDVSTPRPPTPPRTPSTASSSPPDQDDTIPKNESTPKQDPISLAYNWKKQTFSYKKLSKINQKDATQILIPKGTKEVEIRPRLDTNKHKKLLVVRIVKLPKLALLGRKLGMFECLWVVGKVE